MPPNNGVGGIARSRSSDIFGTWDYDYWRPAYTTEVRYAGGAQQFLSQRERPKLFTDGDETWLINGVAPAEGNRQCYTMVQRVVAGL